MITILECNLYEPLKLLRIYGYIDSTQQEEILVYKDGIELGKAKKNIWTAHTEKLKTGKVNFVFTKVIENTGGGIIAFEL